MSQQHAGRCLCGAVTFEITGLFESFFLCHCSRCRKDTGSAHGAVLFSSTARLEWRSGSARTFQLAGTRHVRSFCPECGSGLPSIQMEGTLLAVPAGCLDSPVDIRPTAHLCYSSRADWDNGLETIPKLDGLPE